MVNIIQNQFPADKIARINELLGQIQAELEGVVVGLNPEDRQKYGSINEQNKLFVNKVYDFVTSQPTHNAPDVDWEDFKKDFAARQFLEPRIAILSSLAYQLESTKIFYDYDNYKDSLAYYDYIRYRAERNIPGAAEVYRELQQFFPRTSRTEKEEQ